MKAQAGLTVLGFLVILIVIIVALALLVGHLASVAPSNSTNVKAFYNSRAAQTLGANSSIAIETYGIAGPGQQSVGSFGSVGFSNLGPVVPGSITLIYGTPGNQYGGCPGAWQNVLSNIAVSVNGKIIANIGPTTSNYTGSLDMLASYFGTDSFTAQNLLDQIYVENYNVSTLGNQQLVIIGTTQGDAEVSQGNGYSCYPYEINYTIVNQSIGTATAPTIAGTTSIAPTIAGTTSIYTSTTSTTLASSTTSILIINTTKNTPPSGANGIIAQIDSFFQGIWNWLFK